MTSPQKHTCIVRQRLFPGFLRSSGSAVPAVSCKAAASSAPDRTLTRQEFALLLFRFASLRGLETGARAALGKFEDADSIPASAEDALSWCVGTGVLQGGAGRLAPLETLSRAQLAVMLRRYANLE